MNITDTNKQTCNVDNAIIKEHKRKIKKQQLLIEKITGVCRTFKKKVHFNDGQQPSPPPNLECESNKAIIMANMAINLVHSHTLTQGIKKFGDDVRQAAFKEVKQLHDRSCFCPIHFNSLTELERKQILQSPMFVTKKRDRTKKG